MSSTSSRPKINTLVAAVAAIAVTTATVAAGAQNGIIAVGGGANGNSGIVPPHLRDGSLVEQNPKQHARGDEVIVKPQALAAEPAPAIGEDGGKIPEGVLISEPKPPKERVQGDDNNDDGMMHILPFPYPLPNNKESPHGNNKEEKKSKEDEEEQQADSAAAYPVGEMINVFDRKKIIHGDDDEELFADVEASIKAGVSEDSVEAPPPIRGRRRWGHKKNKFGRSLSKSDSDSKSNSKLNSNSDSNSNSRAVELKEEDANEKRPDGHHRRKDMRKMKIRHDDDREEEDEDNEEGNQEKRNEGGHNLQRFSFDIDKYVAAVGGEGEGLSKWHHLGRHKKEGRRDRRHHHRPRDDENSHEGDENNNKNKNVDREGKEDRRNDVKSLSQNVRKNDAADEEVPIEEMPMVDASIHNHKDKHTYKHKKRGGDLNPHDDEPPHADARLQAKNQEGRHPSIGKGKEEGKGQRRSGSPDIISKFVGKISKFLGISGSLKKDETPFSRHHKEEVPPMAPVLLRQHQMSPQQQMKLGEDEAVSFGKRGSAQDQGLARGKRADFAPWILDKDPQRPAPDVVVFTVAPDSDKKEEPSVVVEDASIPLAAINDIEDREEAEAGRGDTPIAVALPFFLPRNNHNRGHQGRLVNFGNGPDEDGGRHGGVPNRRGNKN